MNSVNSHQIVVSNISYKADCRRASANQNWLAFTRPRNVGELRTHAGAWERSAFRRR